VPAEIPGAGTADIDDAYTAAVRAQQPCAVLLPVERAEILLAASRVIAARRTELTGWLTREAGSTQPWAEMIWRHARFMAGEAAG
jgi:aldehyde dehydrogenase (NAD+)